MGLDTFKVLVVTVAGTSLLTAAAAVVLVVLQGRSGLVTWFLQSPAVSSQAVLVGLGSLALAIIYIGTAE
ncbi:MAG: hypothetical protein SVU32_00260 [Candidatus Nanohaloarchaea archaeon]|nr:hypothetical protein [Candidatus Nanohaloarchaea archaeon]